MWITPFLYILKFFFNMSFCTAISQEYLLCQILAYIWNSRLDYWSLLAASPNVTDYSPHLLLNNVTNNISRRNEKWSLHMLIQFFVPNPCLTDLPWGEHLQHSCCVFCPMTAMVEAMLQLPSLSTHSWKLMLLMTVTVIMSNRVHSRLDYLTVL